MVHEERSGMDGLHAVFRCSGKWVNTFYKDFSIELHIACFPDGGLQIEQYVIDGNRESD